jgi:YARHG domain
MALGIASIVATVAAIPAIVLDLPKSPQTVQLAPETNVNTPATPNNSTSKPNIPSSTPNIPSPIMTNTPNPIIPANPPQTSQQNYDLLSSQPITNADLEGLSEIELDLASNAIFARYGRRFKDAESR